MPKISKLTQKLSYISIIMFSIEFSSFLAKNVHIQCTIIPVSQAIKIYIKSTRKSK